MAIVCLSGSSSSLTFGVTGTNPFPNLVYVWKFWDGEVITTTGTTVSKYPNRGGVTPLPFSVTIVDPYGQYTEVNSSVTINSPPVVSSVAISDNDQPAGYSTTITVTATDPEGGAITYQWKSNGAIIPSEVLPTLAGYVVNSNQTVKAILTDSLGGVTEVDIPLRTTDPASPPVLSAITPSPGSTVTITLGATITLQLSASDPQGRPLAFQWTFDGIPLTSSESTLINTTTSTATFDLTHQSPGFKTVRCIVTDGYFLTAEAELIVTLLPPP